MKMRIVHELLRVNELEVKTTKPFVTNIAVFTSATSNLSWNGLDPHASLSYHRVPRSTYSTRSDGTYLFDEMHLGKIVRLEYVTEEECYG